MNRGYTFFPIGGKLTGFTLESKISNVKRELKKAERNKNNIVNAIIELLPEEVMDTRTSEIWYIDTPVDAITTKPYIFDPKNQKKRIVDALNEGTGMYQAKPNLFGSN